MSEHRYILEPYKGRRSRYACPGCGYAYKFTRYIDAVTNEQLSSHVGRCDRENNCGYHYTPKQFFADNPIHRNIFRPSQPAVSVQKTSCPIDYLPFDVFDMSVSRCEQCNFYPFLRRLFRNGVAAYLCREYFIGANKRGDTVFWQVDINGKIRQAKLIRYNPSTGRRSKKIEPVFAGKSILGNPDANLQQCFFGEYRLSFPENSSKPVAIVESEKTAVISSVYYPHFVWLATGGKHGCKWTEKEVGSVLAKRKVILFADVGAYHSWKEKGRLLANVAGCKVVTSDLLENYASESDRKDGLDIADYLLRTEDGSGLALTDYGYPVIWDFK